MVLGEMLYGRSFISKPSILRFLFPSRSDPSPPPLLLSFSCLHSSIPPSASPQRHLSFPDPSPLHPPTRSLSPSLIRLPPRKHKLASSTPCISKNGAGRHHPHALSPPCSRLSPQRRTASAQKKTIIENSNTADNFASTDNTVLSPKAHATDLQHERDASSATSVCDSAPPQKHVIASQRMRNAVLENEICLQLANTSVVQDSIDAEYLAQKMKTKDIVERLEKQGLPPLVAHDILDAIPCSKRTAVNFEQLLSLVSFLRTMDMDTDKISVLVRSAPFMYQRDPNIHLEPKILYLETLGISRKDMCRLILKYPYSLYRPMEVIEAQIQFLRSLSLDEKHLQKIIKKSPLAFRLDAESHLQPRLEFLQRLGLFPNDVKKAVLNNSRILSMTSDKLKKTADYLQTLGFKVGTEQLSKVILRCGSVTCETLQEGLKNLSEVGLSQQEVEMLLIRLPIVLSRKRADTSSKFKYLVEVMNRSPNEILACPVFLMLSLDKRIMPRYEALSRWREENQVAKEYSLSYIFLPSDKVLSSRFPGINLRRP